MALTSISTIVSACDECGCYLIKSTIYNCTSKTLGAF